MSDNMTLCPVCREVSFKIGVKVHPTYAEHLTRRVCSKRCVRAFLKEQREVAREERDEERPNEVGLDRGECLGCGSVYADCTCFGDGLNPGG